MCPFIKIAQWNINSYFLMIHMGFLAFAIYFYYVAFRVEHISFLKITLFNFLLYLIQWPAGAAVPILLEWKNIASVRFENFLTQGRFFHSTFIICLFYVILFCRIMKWPVRRFMDHYAIGACLFSAVSRIGCFMYGCCVGKISDAPWAMQFVLTDYERRLPTQLYHFFFEGFVIVPLLIYIQSRKRFDGQTFWMYALIYSIFRFIIEFWRDHPIAWGGLTDAQLISIAVILGAGYYLYKNRHRNERAV